MNVDLFKKLLLAGESAKLDYKSKQYAFSGAADHAKAELLKDVLAMANAWGEGDGYILIGAEELPGRPARVVGIQEHLDDAALQQFVNGKTNRPIQFSYCELDADNQHVASIHIPQQQRPFFLLKQFATLRASVVYIRRGSSTDEADPDEVHRMGEALKAVPRLDLQWAHRTKRQSLGRTLKVTTEIVDPLPDSELPKVREGNPYGVPMVGSVNRQYYEQQRDYICVTKATARLAFVLFNRSSTVALGVRAKFRLAVDEDILLIADYPQKPEYKRPLALSFHVNPNISQIHRDVWFRRYGDSWHIEVEFGKVQPGAEAWANNYLVMGARKAMTLSLQGDLFGDNFDPVSVSLEIEFAPRRRPMTLADLKSTQQ